MTTQAITPAASPARGYAVTVRRARAFLQALLLATLATGLVSTLVSFGAVQDTLQRYRAIVADSAQSADAAQAARAAILAHHSAAADFLSEAGTPAAASAADASDARWRDFQEALRRIWGNRSDAEFGEYRVFEAADRATLRYRSGIDAMFAFSESGDREAAERAFLGSHQTLVREVLPALNGLESVKLESMEAAYATTNSAITRWQQTLLVVGGLAVALLLLGFFLTRFWLHYAWTWELAVASLVGLLLFAWFNFTLLRAASEAEVLVRQAYDTVSGVQSIEALLTQAEALESMAIFNRDNAPAFLRDADEYLFLLEQGLCGERDCSTQSFLAGDGIAPEARDAAVAGQQTYGLARTPLVASAYSNRFRGEAAALEGLRIAVQSYREANAQLDEELLAQGGEASEAQQTSSRAAYEEALAASEQVRTIARGTFDRIYEQVTTAMEINRWLALLFTGLALLGFWGLRRRRQALFA